MKLQCNKKDIKYDILQLKIYVHCNIRVANNSIKFWTVITLNKINIIANGKKEECIIISAIHKKTIKVLYLVL